MKDIIKQRIEQLYARIKMVEINYKNDCQTCEERYKCLCESMQEELTILNMAMNSPD